MEQIKQGDSLVLELLNEKLTEAGVVGWLKQDPFGRTRLVLSDSTVVNGQRAIYKFLDNAKHNK